MPLLVLISISLLSLNFESSPHGSQQNIFEENTILYIFTGSDWCADCRRLEKNVLSDPVFVKTMEQNKIEIQIIDFPQRKKLDPDVVKYNESIAETYGFKGIFPTLILSQTKNNFQTLKYKNEKADEFSEQILDKLKHLNE